MLVSSTEQKKVAEEHKEAELQKSTVKQQQENNIVMQLKAIVVEKEATVKALEDEVNSMKHAVST